MHTSIRMVLVGLALVLVSAPCLGQDVYPKRSIRMIVPFAPGGTSDVVARVLVPKLSEVLGQPIVVENRAGASGNLGTEAAARAAPDGYTIYLGNIGTIAINPAIFGNLSVNPAKDLMPVTLVADVPNLLIINPSVPANNVAELVAYAKANPGVLNFASTGSGSLSRLEMEQFRKVAGIDVVHIPYKGGAAPALTGMLSGETHAMFVTVSAALGFIEAGRLKALGISSTKRIETLPQVPTMVEAGFPRMISGSWQGVFVPVGTPHAIVQTLHEALIVVLGSTEIRVKLAGAGVPVVTSRTPEDFASFVGAEVLRWSQVSKDAGATVD